MKAGDTRKIKIMLYFATQDLEALLTWDPVKPDLLRCTPTVPPPFRRYIVTHCTRLVTGTQYYWLI